MFISPLLFNIISRMQEDNSKSNSTFSHPQFDRQFINDSLKMMIDFVQTTLKGANNVINFKSPQSLKAEVDFSIDQKPCSKDYLIKVCQTLLNNQVKPYHPHFHNQLFGGFDQFSLIGAMMAPCINGSVYTYEISACWTLMENLLYQKLRALLEWETIDGTFTPGGSFANFMSILLARHRQIPDCKQNGFYGSKPMKLFASNVSHYSLKKGVVLCGLGTKNIVSVESDKNGRMIPSELEKAIKKQIENDCIPLLVMATCGTTVEGAIDPLTEIGQICKKYKIWYHVDAAFGGSFLMSPDLRKKMGSLKDVDSVTWDPHKTLVVPLQASFFVCKHPGMMKNCNQAKADYLFHKQRASYDSCLDVGDKSLQCGRVIDVLKLWAYLKGNGWQNIGKQVESEHSLALYNKEYILKRPDRWILAIQEVDTFNVCFWYIPEKLKRQEYASEQEYKSILSKITVLAKKFMIQEGKILIGYSSSKSPHYFWRTVMSNPFITTADVDYEFELLAKYSEQSYESIFSTTA